jgi:hypothetical protein
MQAYVPRNSSVTWRAIVGGREALATWLIEKSWDYFSISTWQDSWIRDTPTLKPRGRMGTLPLKKISDLIDSETGT